MEVEQAACGLLEGVCGHAPALKQAARCKEFVVF
jgi:hypothetical protein